MPRALDLIVGGWKTAGVWTIHDGFPLQFTVTNGGTPIYTYGSQRPNLVGTPEFSGGPESNWINNYFANPNVFQAPAPYTLGNAPRTVGTVRSPFFFSTNLSILKEFAVVPKHEQMKLELRLEAQNAFNHPVFGTPDTYVGDPNFGVVSYTAVGHRPCRRWKRLHNFVGSPAASPICPAISPQQFVSYLGSQSETSRLHAI